jgi:ubiquinone/menaquinone biosynthesis C-methylase UbiE
MNPHSNQALDPVHEHKMKNTHFDKQGVHSFDDIASSVFAPIYPVIADQILERTGKSRGTAIDAGCGPAHLAVAVAQKSQLKVFALDSSPMMLEKALNHITSAGLVQKVVPVLGDIHAIPFEDGTIDLLFSRGSWFFWNDLKQAFQEISRVLAPGGRAYIGGGFGNQQLKELVFSIMKKKDPGFENGVKERLAKNSPDRIRDILHQAGIRSFDLIQDESGFWVIMKR